MKVGNLFNGIGGFALAAHWMGWENVMHCEIDPFCNRVMKYHFPNSFQYEDIRTTDFTIWRGTIDVLTGGFPCQPYSTAGKRLGKADERHLWPHMLRAIQEISPRWVVGENVRGLTNWNGGLVFDEVQADLESAGYEVTPFILPAASVNAPHRRDRIFFVAHAIGTGAGNINRKANNQGWAAGKDRTESLRQTYGQACSGGVDTTDSHGPTSDSGCGISDRREDQQGVNDHYGQNGGREEEANKPERLCQKGHDADTNSHGLEVGIQPGGGGVHETPGSFPGSEPGRTYTKTDWGHFPTQSPICSRNDGVPPRLDGITIPRFRRESIKAAGNAIVPQVAYNIFRAIEQYSLSTQD